MAIVPTGNLPLCTHRYLLMVSYLGSKYIGSQRQTGRDATSTQNTVQECIESSLETFLPKRWCKLTASSRTDKGVHALMNCYTLPLMDLEMPTERMRRMLNQNLIKRKHDINVNDVVLVPADFHPRNSAIRREYIFRIAVFDDAKFSNLSEKYTSRDMLNLLPITELYRILPLTSLDPEKALEVIDLFNGRHDFASFAIEQEGQPDTVRDISISITKSAPSAVVRDIPYMYSQYEIHFKSRAFLYNQIRRMVGALLAYASFDKIKLDRIKFMLDNPDGKNWSPRMTIADPWGLFLSRIIYSRSSFKGAIKTMQDKTEIPVDEFNLPATIGLSDDEPLVGESTQAPEAEQNMT